MKCLRHIIVILSVAIACLASGCGREKDAPAGDDVALVSVGDTTLWLSEVVRQIPQGLAETDSAEMFSGIVDAWIQDVLLTEVAADNLPDLDRIERMVADYRNRLIMMEYRKRMKNDSRRNISDAEVKEYYEAHADDMRLEHPVVKGIYIKLPSDADRLENVRQWVFSATRESIDKLEKYGLKGAIQYDWFGDRWVDWEMIATQIPYRFYDADAFVESTVNFETEYNGSTYFLHISEYLKSGDVMPYQFAVEQIREALSERELVEADRKLMRSLFSRAVSDGKLRPGAYDPVKRRMKNGAPAAKAPASDKKDKQQ